MTPAAAPLANDSTIGMRAVPRPTEPSGTAQSAASLLVQNGTEELVQLSKISGCLVGRGLFDREGQSWRGWRLIANVSLLVALGACGREAAAPTDPSPPEPLPGSLQIAVSVDGFTARDAVAGLSEVSVDISATASGPLTYSV